MTMVDLVFTFIGIMVGIGSDSLEEVSGSVSPLSLFHHGLFASKRKSSPAPGLL